MNQYERRFYEDIHKLVIIQEKILKELQKMNKPIIVDKEAPKKIEKLDLDGYYDDNSYCECKSEWCASEDVLVVKINELIDEVNKLKESE